jgi:hypothetical protein
MIMRIDQKHWGSKNMARKYLLLGVAAIALVGASGTANAADANTRHSDFARRYDRGCRDGAGNRDQRLVGTMLRL